MLNYIKKCDERGYPAAEDYFIDHHAILTISTVLNDNPYLQKYIDAESELLELSYSVLSSMCEG